jgi:hypothetical protein
MLEQPQKPVIVDLFPHNGEEFLVIEALKALGNVALDEPVRPFPHLHHFL